VASKAFGPTIMGGGVALQMGKLNIKARSFIETMGFFYRR
jgi:hypothetical protein